MYTVFLDLENTLILKRTMIKSVSADNTGYVQLGGRRYEIDSGDIINSGWRNKSFQAYADYMRTPEFEGCINELSLLAKHNTIAIMCAEALPRLVIADL
jgi:hypothetical protein